MKRYWSVFILTALLAGCTVAEVKEGFLAAGQSATDAGSAIVANPGLITTPAGVIFVLSTFFSGFLSREVANLTARGVKPGAGLLARFLTRLFPTKGSDASPPIDPAPKG